MHITSLHTHTNYCDGKCSAEEMVLAAINSNMQSIGISTHGPTPFESDWNISKDNIKKYINEVNSLKEKYKYSIDIFLGMELDFIPGIGFDDYSKSLITELDYYIGSVHYLGTFKNGVMWTVDYNLEELIRGIDESFSGDKRLAVERYYEFISEMAYLYQPPIIGHLDLFKKNNKDNILFDEKADWYISAVDKCLDVVKDTSSIIEVNTGGIARGYTKEQYPSDLILSMIKDKNIPIIINSDAHTTDGINCKYEDMYSLVMRTGFKKISYLSVDGWKNQDLIFN